MFGKLKNSYAVVLLIYIDLSIAMKNNLLVQFSSIRFDGS